MRNWLEATLAGEQRLMLRFLALSLAVAASAGSMPAITRALWNLLARSPQLTVWSHELV